MIRRLADERCAAVRPGESPLPADELARLCEALCRWTLTRREGVLCLVKVFRFKYAGDGRCFADRLARLADRQDHHPEVTIQGDAVTVAWWTHRLGGLHRNDFIMAAQTDRLADAGAD